MNKLNILVIRFRNPIFFSQVPLFRGAVIRLLGDNVHLLFHNHIEDKFRYSYPLIQYKRIHGNAAIVCMKEGTEEIGRLFSQGTMTIQLGDTPVHLEIERIQPRQVTVQAWNSFFRYRIRKWLPLNSVNYDKYIHTEGAAERIKLLESILTANLLSFTKGVGIHIDQPLVVNITEISQPYQMLSKHVKLMAFDVEFKANLSLPDFAGIGKHASIGYGVVTRVRERKDKNNKE